MKILVTGCAGYIGSMITEELLTGGYEVVGIDNFRYNNQQAILPLLKFHEFHFHNDDVRNIEGYAHLLKDVDVVMPLAAIVGAPACDRVPSLAEEVNCFAITSLLGYLSQQQRVIFPNTNSGYGSVADKQCDEDTPMTPVSWYGKTKCNAEKAILDRGNSVSFRLATVCGASRRMRFDLLVNDFTAKLYFNKQLEVYEPHYYRNFIHIVDVVHCFRFAVHNPLCGIFNFGNPSSNLNKVQLANLIAHILDLDKSVITFTEGKDTDQRNYVVNNDKIISVGYSSFLPITLAIREVINVCKLYNKAADIRYMSNV